MDYMMGIDVGTTNIKAVIYDQKGKRAAYADAPSPTRIKDGISVFFPEELWGLVCRLIRKAVGELCEKQGQAAAARIVGVAATGMAEAGVLLSAQKEELFPIIVWNDTCTRGMEIWWREVFGEKRLMEITGQRAQYKYSVNKLQWIAKNHPDVFSRAEHWLCVPDYIGFKLSGVMAMDYSIACRTMMFDLYQNQWSKEICEAADIPMKLLPQLAESSTELGRVSEKGAKQCGLSRSTRIFVGGHDHICGAMASGVLNEASLLDSSGTAEQYLTVIPDVERVKALCAMGYDTGKHVAGGLNYLAGAVPSSGRTVDWFRREFFSGEPSVPGARGLTFLPHLDGGSAPERNSAECGAFSGIRPFHTPEDFMQAVYEGLCFELKRGIERLCREYPRRIVVTGGGTRNKVWMQTKANILGHEILIPEEYQSTALGAALLAGIGAGIFNSAQDASQKTFRTAKSYVPENSFDYTAAYERHKAVSDALKGVYSPE